jgi:hypothetical protein
LKLSESKKTTEKPDGAKHTKPTGKGNVSGNSSKNIASGSSSYVAVSKSANPEGIRTPKKHANNEQSAMPGDFASLSNQDVFSSILQSSFPSTVTPPSASGSEFSSKTSSFGGGGVYTLAESDKDPYQKLGEEKANSGSKCSPPPVRQTNSIYQSRAAVSSDTPTRVQDSHGQKPRAKTPELTSVLETDISQFSHASLDDLLGMTSQAGDSTGSEMDTTVHTGSEMGNCEPEASTAGITFDDRDPFAEISPPQQEVNRQLPLKARNDSENERREPRRDFASEVVVKEVVSDQRSNAGDKIVVVTSYSNAAPPQRSGAGEASNPPSDSQQPTSSSSGRPPDDHDGRTPPPLGRKPNANRKVSSEINVEYAKVSIQKDESSSYDEPTLGAVGGAEPGTDENDVTEQDEPGDNKTEVDIFDIPSAEESIEKLSTNILL